MSVSFSIRPAEIGDNDDLQRVMVNSWRKVHTEFLDAEIPSWMDENLGEYYQSREHSRRVKDDEQVYLVADVGGSAVGKINITRTEATTSAFVDPGDAQIRSHYVDPDHWRQGIGRRLLLSGMAHLPEDVETIHVESFSNNTRACSFYESLGFRAYDESSIELYGDPRRTTLYRRQADAESPVEPDQ